MLEATGAAEAATVLGQIGPDSDTYVGEALTAHGRTVVTAAGALAPVRTGKLKAAMTSVYQPSTGLVVDAGTATAPHAYTMHATFLKVANGFMTFTVPGHTRRGSAVRAYRSARPIPNRPYLTTAWDKALPKMFDLVQAAIAKAVT